MAERIAVTVVGGYLGAGKTTLVNHLLGQAPAGPGRDPEHIAVLVNDFGEVNIDVDLIERRSEHAIELSNGCICCSMIDGFSETLDRIAAMDPRPDRLVIETSGVADPATVAAYGHGPGFALDAVIVLADAETIRASADDRYVGQTVRQQLAAAEVLVVNKADLVSEADLAATLDWLAAECPDVLVLTTTQARVEAEVLFGRPSDRPFEASPRRPDAGPGGDRAHADTGGGHVHADRGGHHPERVFETRTLERDAVERDWVDDLMASLDPERTVRAKGLVWIAGDEHPQLLQRVGKRWSLRPSPVPWPGDPATRIVIIELAPS